MTLARTDSFEAVAEWLWSGATPDPGEWVSDPDVEVAARRVVAALPAGAGLLDRLSAATVGVGSGDPMRHDRSAAGIASTGRRLIPVMAGAVREPPPLVAADVGADPAVPRGVAATLWASLSPQAAPPGAVEALDAALVLMADHELAASTLAAGWLPASGPTLTRS